MCACGHKVKGRSWALTPWVHCDIKSVWDETSRPPGPPCRPSLTYFQNSIRICLILLHLMLDAILPHIHQQRVRYQVSPYHPFSMLIWIANCLEGRNWKARASCSASRQPRRRERQREGQSSQLVGENTKRWQGIRYKLFDVYGRKGKVCGTEMIHFPRQDGNTGRIPVVPSSNNVSSRLHCNPFRKLITQNIYRRWCRA